MNILQVIDSLRVGGSESLAATLAEQFALRGMGNHICGLGADGPLRDRLDAAGVPATHLVATAGIRPGAMLALARLVRRERADVILTHHFRQLVHAVPAACLLRKTLVHVEHDYHSYEARPDVIGRFGQLAPFVHRFVFVSENIREWFVERLPRLAPKCAAIPNGVDTDRFQRDLDARARVREWVGAAENDFVVGTCARLEPIKDLPLLLDGFARMGERMKGTGRTARLVLVGDGSLRGELAERARALGIEDRCRFAGVVDDVHNWLSGMDAYAITSVDEGLPLSVMEAMSADLPVVAVNVGSLADVIDPEVGALLEGRSPDELAARLADLAAAPETARGLGRNGRTRIVKTHSVAVMVDDYLAAMR